MFKINKQIKSISCDFTDALVPRCCHSSAQHNSRTCLDSQCSVGKDSIAMCRVSPAWKPPHKHIHTEWGRRVLTALCVSCLKRALCSSDSHTTLSVGLRLIEDVRATTAWHWTVLAKRRPGLKPILPQLAVFFWARAAAQTTAAKCLPIRWNWMGRLAFAARLFFVRM